MGAHHAEGQPRDVTPEPEPPTEVHEPVAARETERRSVDWRRTRGRISDVLAGVVRWVGLVLALVLVLDVLFVVGEANADNGIVVFVSDAASAASIGFEDLFLPDDPKLEVLLNHGIAAIFWLVASSIAVRVVRLALGGGGVR
ncbi:hypothetical protein B1813_12350 [Saccharomonospora piscinae]|uniref:Uncharacterized protein n=1 Tax=Saccharomonospora piscinae TaxID=687388 RepID=A0A1V9A783_SACPI|nr:hypothetical protein [Saccharomonospora piscinae]OQO92908.1 hypothetical protein B1813_12350 [Saccharomonospora piscinae]